MGDHHHGPAKGITRWLFTTNHKDIGTMYLWFSFAMFILGGFFAMVIRAELFEPGMQLVRPEFFNQMTTMHGLVIHDFMISYQKKTKKESWYKKTKTFFFLSSL